METPEYFNPGHEGIANGAQTVKSAEAGQFAFPDVSKSPVDHGAATSIPLETEQGLTGRGFIKSTGKTFTGTIYVAAGSGGSPTIAVTVVNGIIQSA